MFAAIAIAFRSLLSVQYVPDFGLRFSFNASFLIEASSTSNGVGGSFPHTGDPFIVVGKDLKHLKASQV